MILKLINMKSFIYLNPVDRYFDIEIDNYKLSHLAECKDDIRARYKRLLAKSIKERYKRNDYSINYVLLRDDDVSSMMELAPDKILRSSMNSIRQKWLEKKGLDYHIDTAEILRLLGPTNEIVVSGFHGDCVDYFAEHAYKSGIQTMVDDELTHLFLWFTRNPGFKTSTFPSVQPENLERVRYGRADKPWLYQF